MTYIEALPRKAQLPDSVLPTPLNQGQTPDCTAYALATALMTARKVAGLPDVTFDPAAFYAIESKQPAFPSLVGAITTILADGFPVVGGAPEKLNGVDFVPYGTAAPHYVDAIKQAIAQGFGVLVSINVGLSFEGQEVTKKGIWQPQWGHEVWLKQHEMLIVEYNEDYLGGMFYCQSTYGAQWGLGGRVWIPMNPPAGHRELITTAVVPYVDSKRVAWSAPVVAAKPAQPKPVAMDAPRTVIAKMIDCATPLTAQNCADLKKTGISAVGRYLGRKSRGFSKGMTPAESSVIHEYGLGILPIWEGDPVDAGYFTPAQGTQDAADAIEDADWLGIPITTPVIFTVDFPAIAQDMNTIRAYLVGVMAGMKGRKYGVYGDYTVMSNVAADAYFQTCGWSGGKVSPRAGIYQAQVDQVISGISVDMDDVYHDPGFWIPPTANSAPKTYGQGYADGIAAAIKTLEGIKR